MMRWESTTLLRLTLAGRYVAAIVQHYSLQGTASLRPAPPAFKHPCQELCQLGAVYRCYSLHFQCTPNIFFVVRCLPRDAGVDVNLFLDPGRQGPATQCMCSTLRCFMISTRPIGD